MFIFEFNLQDYFKSYRYITSLVRFFREKQDLTRLKVSKDLDIPFTSYRRIEEDPNFKNINYINRVADYFNINRNISNELVSNLNTSLERFYHALIYGFKDIEEPYQRIISLEDECKHSFLMIFIYMAKFTYYVVKKDVKSLIEFDEHINMILFMFDELQHKHQFILYLFLSTYYSLLLDYENTAKTHVKVLSYLDEFTNLKAFTFRQITHNYIILEDWTNALFYALKTKDLLIVTDNYYGLIINRLHFAEVFFNIRNYDEALNILNSLGSFLILHESHLIPLEAKVLHSSLYLLLNKEKELINILNRDKTEVNELKLIRLYIYYLIDKEKFKEYKDSLNELDFNIDQLRVYKIIVALFNEDKSLVNRLLKEVGSCHLNVLKNLIKVIKFKVKDLGY